jgi:hypothetical protein
MKITDDPGGLETECMNCGRESHFLGFVCWWGVAVIALAVVICTYLIWAKP